MVGVHLFLSRILILCGWTRMLWSKMAKSKDGIPGGLNEIDKLFIVWALIRAVATPNEQVVSGNPGLSEKQSFPCETAE